MPLYNFYSKIKLSYNLAREIYLRKLLRHDLSQTVF